MSYDDTPLLHYFTIHEFVYWSGNGSIQSLEGSKQLQLGIKARTKTLRSDFIESTIKKARKNEKYH